MEVFLGFLIALAIAITGVGAGTITAPMLILFLHLPLSEAVGTALIFAVTVKMIAVPVYWFRRKINFRALGFLVLGGLPGVFAGSLLSKSIMEKYEGIIFLILGFTVIFAAAKVLFPLKKEHMQRK